MKGASVSAGNETKIGQLLSYGRLGFGDSSDTCVFFLINLKVMIFFFFFL